MSRLEYLFIAAFVLHCSTLGAQTTNRPASAGVTQQNPANVPGVPNHQSYMLGAADQITVWAVDVDEISGKTYTIDSSGYVSMPMIGRLKADGLTVEEFEKELNTALKVYVIDPRAAVSVATFRSQPVTVLGAVRNPGQYQLQANNTLTDLISAAGGIAEGSGTQLKLSRTLDQGRIPLENSVIDESEGVSMASIRLRDVLAGTKYNLPVRPHDLIVVDKGNVIYVFGEVTKPGEFPLKDRDTVSVVEALAMAGGVNRTASVSNLRILHADGSGPIQKEMVNLKEAMNGKAVDRLKANDILFVSDSPMKRAMRRSAEAAVQGATWLFSWGLIR